METPIITAIISGTVAIVSPIITYIITRRYDQRALGKVEGRRKAVAGKWRGNYTQVVRNYTQVIQGELVTTDLAITLTAGKKVIEGTGEFVSPMSKQLVKIKITGGFYYERFVKLDYTNVEELAVQFGCIILNLSDDGQTLEGRYIGYGNMMKEILTGEVILHRTA